MASLIVLKDQATRTSFLFASFQNTSSIIILTKTHCYPQKKYIPDELSNRFVENNLPQLPCSRSESFSPYFFHIFPQQKVTRIFRFYQAPLHIEFLQFHTVVALWHNSIPMVLLVRLEGVARWVHVDELGRDMKTFLEGWVGSLENERRVNPEVIKQVDFQVTLRMSIGWVLSSNANFQGCI